MTTMKAILLAAVTMLFGGFVGAVLGARYSTWKEGHVVAEAGGGTLKIREIPTQFPSLNDGHAYRCEVWSQNLLCKATMLRYEDFSAQPGKCSIEILSPSLAIFHIDGYDIECTRYGMSDDTHSTSAWKRLNE
jgi:hypothetical protein